MNDRQRAMEVLREARAILAERLTELVLSQQAELLDDARGDSYMNEIESLYDQVGHKLSHLGQMLNHLPAEDTQPPTETYTAAASHSPDSTFTVATEPAPNADAITQYTLPALCGPVSVSILGLPAPGLPAPGSPVPGSPAPGSPAPRVSEPMQLRATNSALQAFAAQIQAGDLLAAGRTLAMLFDVEEPRAVACAATFAQRVRSEAAFFRKVMELRSELHSSDTQRALLLLLDCFGLSRGESAEILRNIHRRRRTGRS